MPVQFYTELPETNDANKSLNQDKRTNSTSIMKTTYNKLVQNFGANFSYRVAGSPLQIPESMFRYADLQNLVPVSGTPHALIVYFGLEGNDVRYGVRIVEMRQRGTGRVHDLDPVLGGAPGNAPTHVLSNGGFVAIADYQTPWDHMSVAYWGEVRIDRIGNGDYQTLTTNDSDTITLPWDVEMRRLWVDNQSGIGGRSAWIVIDSLSHFHLTGDGIQGPQGFRHGVGFHVVVDDAGVLRPLMDDTDWGVLYMNKGADFGNLCPPSCDTYTSPVLLQ